MAFPDVAALRERLANDPELGHAVRFWTGALHLAAGSARASVRFDAGRFADAGPSSAPVGPRDVEIAAEPGGVGEAARAGSAAVLPGRVRRVAPPSGVARRRRRDALRVLPGDPPRARDPARGARLVAPARAPGRPLPGPRGRGHRATRSTSRRPARACRCSCSTPRAPTRASGGTCSRTRGSPSASA